MSGASKYIKKALNAKPVAAIILATFVGAFSSCTVIPIISALLISGVPLPPVMSFWIASPLMDPEIFFLSIGTIGFNLAVWQLAGALFISLAAGFITLFLMEKGYLGQDFLKKSSHQKRSTFNLTHLKTIAGQFSSQLKKIINPNKLKPAPVPACCSPVRQTVFFQQPSAASFDATHHRRSDFHQNFDPNLTQANLSFGVRLRKETIDATWMVIKFMALAFFLEAIVVLYVPDQWITGILGKENPLSILIASFLGVPVYTSNLSALPLISGLLAQGMEPSAALAFLISGPTTTLPAMAAVWTLVQRRIFFLYISLAFLGAVFLGYLYLLWNSL